jgi:hypothetical protein
MRMRWEYKTLTVTTVDYDGSLETSGYHDIHDPDVVPSPYKSDLNVQLASLGALGWELVSTQQITIPNYRPNYESVLTTQYRLVLFLKRQRSEDVMGGKWDSFKD